MMAPAAVPDPHSGPDVFPGRSEGGALRHGAHIGAGVCIGVDLMDPGQWQSISADVMDDAATSLLAAVTGSLTPRSLSAFDVRSAVQRYPNALAWTRVAMVDALD